MFLKLVTIEWTRLSRRALLWITLIICSLYIGLSLANFYKLNRPELLAGTLKMPGMAYDLANSLDQLLIAIPFLIMIAGTLMGSDYSQRTNRLWLRRVPRHTSLLARFTLLALLTLGIQWFTLLVGWAVGSYYKSYVYQVPNLLNVNWNAVLAAPFYMTLVNLPYIALTLLLAVVLRSTFLSVVIALGYTQFLEFLLTGIFHGSAWTRWLFTNLHFSASFLLNSIGNRAAEIPTYVFRSTFALEIAIGYSMLFLVLAIWMYRRQDIAG